MPLPASRTPEGWPSRCVLCGAANAIDFSDTGGDAPCPSCGCLLLRSQQIADRVRLIFAGPLGLANLEDADRLDFAADSLAVAELVMELEEDGLNLPPEKLAGVTSVGALVRLAVEHADG